MAASGPAARPALAFFELLLGPSDPALSGRILLGVFDPADELVAGQRCDVVPGEERLGIGHEFGTEVGRKPVDHTAGHS